MNTTVSPTQVQRLEAECRKAWAEYYALSRRTSQAWDRYYQLATQLRAVQPTGQAEAS